MVRLLAKEHNYYHNVFLIGLILIAVSLPPTSEFKNSPCQKSGGSRLYIFDVERAKCVLVYSANCPKNMEIQSFPDNESYGFCDCIVSRPAVYNVKSGACYLLYKQEYCYPGQWLIYNNRGEVVCAKNKCNYLKSGEHAIALYKGQCVRLGASHPDCGPYETLIFQAGEFEPICSGLSVGNLGGSVPNLQCSEGSKWSHLTEKCQRTYAFRLE